MEKSRRRSERYAPSPETFADPGIDFGNTHLSFSSLEPRPRRFPPERTSFDSEEEYSKELQKFYGVGPRMLKFHREELDEALEDRREERIMIAGFLAAEANGPEAMKEIADNITETSDFRLTRRQRREFMEALGEMSTSDFEQKYRMTCLNLDVEQSKIYAPAAGRLRNAAMLMRRHRNPSLESAPLPELEESLPEPTPPLEFDEPPLEPESSPEPEEELPERDEEVLTPVVNLYTAQKNNQRLSFFSKLKDRFSRKKQEAEIRKNQIEAAGARERSRASGMSLDPAEENPADDFLNVA
ncbi:hypothetical protein IKE71_03140 [Candidatus Saccharibacteria bacterium]|nr:hypothetical protein [Candidatus Saccharibacteria bacterium]